MYVCIYIAEVGPAPVRDGAPDQRAGVKDASTRANPLFVQFRVYPTKD